MLSACSTISDEEIISKGANLKGREAQEYYASSPIASAKIEYNLAYSYLETKDFNSALQIALSCQEKYPDYLRFYTLEAYCRKMLDDTLGYQEALKKTLSVDPGYVEVYEMLLSSYVDKEDKENTIAYAKELLKIDHKNETALKALALYYPFYAELTGYDPSEKELKNIMQGIDSILIPTPELKKISSN